MAQEVAITALSRELGIEIDNLTGKEFKATVVKIAEAERDKVIQESKAESGVTPFYTQAVNNQLGAPLDAIEPGGKIVFNFDYIAEVATFTLALLRSLSPVLTGNYRNHHAIFIDGREAADLSGMKAGSEVTFTNTEPYARRIEHGSSRQAPNGVYELASAVVGRRYGRLLYVNFTYRGLVGSTLHSKRDALRRDRSKPRGEQHYNDSEARWPSIELRPFR